MEVNCVNCIYGEIVANSGDVFTLLDPVGNEIKKSHSSTIVICRESPPITGEWPHVSENDWCGRWKDKLNLC